MAEAKGRVSKGRDSRKTKSRSGKKRPAKRPKSPAPSGPASGEAAAKARPAATRARTRGPSPARRAVASGADAAAASPLAARSTTKPRSRKTAARGGSGQGRRAADAARQAVAPTRVPAADASSLTEEERIESAKYLSSVSRPRLFEEERFLFPETYGINRVRLHVKDPEWLFAYWDVSPESFSTLRAEVGERSMALSRLTLRVSDAANGGTSVILLPPGVRSWYLRTAGGRRSYRAELGVTLPSGEFRRLAESNTVVAPRGGPSEEPVRERRRSYKQARALSPAAAAAATQVEQGAVAGGKPWNIPPQDGDARVEVEQGGAAQPRATLGGASDAYRR